MGVYLVSVSRDDWQAECEDEGSVPALAAATLESAKLVLPPFGDEPFGFEEKFFMDQGTFMSLVASVVGDAALFDAEVWLPVAFEGTLEAAGPGAYVDPLMVGSSVTLLSHLQRVAAHIGLPAEVPAGDNLAIGMWFEEQEVAHADDDAPLWRRDLEASFYVATFLRAAEHSTKYRVPLRII